MFNHMGFAVFSTFFNTLPHASLNCSEAFDDGIRMQGTKSCDSNGALDCHLLLTFSCDSLHASLVKHSMFVLLPRFAATSFRPKVKSKVWPP